MFEDLNYEELKRRANARLPDRVVATLEDLEQVHASVTEQVQHALQRARAAPQAGVAEPINRTNRTRL